MTTAGEASAAIERSVRKMEAMTLRACARLVRDLVGRGACVARAAVLGKGSSPRMPPICALDVSGFNTRVLEATCTRATPHRAPEDSHA